MPFDMAPDLHRSRIGQTHQLEQLGALGRAAVGAGQVLVERDQLVSAEPVREPKQLRQIPDGRPRGRRAGR